MTNPIVKIAIDKGIAMAVAAGRRVGPANLKAVFTEEMPEGLVEVAPSENPGVLELRIEPPTAPSIKGRADRYRAKQAAAKALEALNAQETHHGDTSPGPG